MLIVPLQFSMEILHHFLLFHQVTLATVCCICGVSDTSQPFDIYKDVHMKIGVIQDGDDMVEIRHENIQGCNVTFHWHHVDMEEAYSVFKAVQQLDNNADVDVIVVFDDLKLEISSATTHILKTKNKPLIMWGKYPGYSLKLKPVPVRDDTGMCPIVPVEPPPTTPYCFYDVSELSRINNGTVIAKITITAPNIVTSLVVKVMHWTSVYIIHENITEKETETLVDKLSDNGVLVVIYNIDFTQNITQTLMQVYKNQVLHSEAINVVVLCTFKCIRKLIMTANEFDNKYNKTLLKQISRWLIASYNHTHQVSETLRACADDLDNVAVIALPAVVTKNPEKEFSDALQREILNYALADNQTREGELYTSVIHYTIGKLTEMASSWLPTSKCEGLIIETLMWKSHSRRDFNNVGYISDEGEVTMFSDLFPNTNFGYNMRKFIVSTLNYSPFVIKSTVNDTIVWEGMCMDLLKELAKTLNFTYVIVEPEDQKWGSLDSDNPKVFNGMIGQLQREEVDIVAADISIQKEREEVMDFAFPFYYGDTSVLLRKPDPNIGKWRTLVDPFKWEVLAAIGITLPIVSVLAFLLEKLNPFYDDPENAQLAKENYGLHTLLDSFWYMYGALLSQGGVNLPESIAGRTFVSCWWMFSIVIVGTYCGNLIAFLTVTKDKPPFNTLEEMAKLKNDYRWGLQAGTHWEVVFTTSKRKEFRTVGDLLIEFNKTDPSVMATDFAVQLANVQKGNYGWIGDTVIIEVEMAKDCELMMIKERFLPLKYAFGFTNNSPHAKIFSEQMLSIHESGLLHVWKRRWWPKATVCSGSVVTQAKPISIIDVQSAFYVAAGGAVIGTLSFFTELIVGRFVKKKRKLQHNSIEQNYSNDIQPSNNAVAIVK